MPLQLTYRPEDFKEMFGNTKVINAVKAILEREEDIPHSWLFQGNSGCGKTTLARIVADQLGCKIDSQDFTELDMAQTTGVESAREIRSNMHFMPMESKCRVWILDEVHMTSKNFQNAMLKACEDAPNHVYFILCTTDPDKIIKTLKGRCHKFEVESLRDKEMMALLDYVVQQEGIELDKEIKQEIIYAAEGCPREALVILDQIIDLPEDQMIKSIITSESREEIKKLCQALLRGESWKKLLKIVKKLDKADPERKRQAIIGYMNAVALNATDERTVAMAAHIFNQFKDVGFNTGMAGITFATYQTTL